MSIYEPLLSVCIMMGFMALMPEWCMKRVLLAAWAAGAIGWATMRHLHAVGAM